MSARDIDPGQFGTTPSARDKLTGGGERAEGIFAVNCGHLRGRDSVLQSSGDGVGRGAAGYVAGRCRAYT
jgi:hypothetical protein